MGQPGIRNGDASEGTLLDILTALGGGAGVGVAPMGPGPGSSTPGDSRIFNIPFTANTAGNKDLSAAAYEGLLEAIQAGKLITIKATAACWYNWATSAITISAASTAEATPATQGVFLFDGERTDERPATNTTRINFLGGTVSGTLVIYIAE